MPDNPTVIASRIDRGISTHSCHVCQRDQPPGMPHGLPDRCVYCHGPVGLRVTVEAMDKATRQIFREHPEFHKPDYPADDEAVARCTSLVWGLLGKQGYCTGHTPEGSE